MSTTKPTGGPAFPCEYVEHKPGAVGNNVAIMGHSEGVSIRDYFAAKAMQSLIVQLPMQGHTVKPAGIAQAAYILADAMLAARQE